MDSNRMILIGISGYSGTGKDSFADALVEDGFVRFAFGDRVKEALYELNPAIGVNRHTGSIAYLKPFIDAQTGSFTDKWDKAKKIGEVRRLLQRLGTNVGRELLSEDVWTDPTMQLLIEDMHDREDRRYIIADVRFPKEAETIHRCEGVVVRIQRPGVGPLRDSKGHTHESEIALDNYIGFDYHIHNDGSIKELKTKVRNLTAHIEGKHSNGN